MKTLSTLAFALLAPALACATGKPPIYGPKSCIDDDGKSVGYAPYVTPNSALVTCLPAEAAVFMMCVRELSLESFTDNRSSEAKITLPSVKSEPVTTEGGAVTTTTTADVTVHYDDKLSDARAEAILKCIEVSRAVARVTATTPAVPAPTTP